MDNQAREFKFKRPPGNTMSERPSLLLACGALAKEVVAIIEHNGLKQFDVQCLPARLHHRPALIPPALEKIFRTQGNQYKKIYVLYGDCGTAGKIDELLIRYDAERIAGPHCFSFFEGNEQFASNEDDITSFFLTDFFCRNFDKFIWQEYGLHKDPGMLELVFGNYRKLVYTAQTKNPDLEQKAREIATRLGLQYEYRFRSYGDLGNYIQTINI